MSHVSPPRRRWARAAVPALVAASIVVVAFSGAPAAQSSQQQTPTFRAGVDLVAVDVQVVDRDGMPIDSLSPDKFQVSINGGRRRVVSADFIREVSIGEINAVRPEREGPIAANLWPTKGPGRVYVLAVDLDSFGVTSSRNVAGAARGFVERLDPSDYVGLYVYPLGPVISPTVDHAAVARGLDSIAGQRIMSSSRFHLSVSDVADITADPMENLQTNVNSTQVQNAARNGTVADVGQSDTVKRIQVRENCTVPRCVELIEQDANTIAYDLESHVMKSTDGLHSLFRALATTSGRKIVVLFSAGVVVTDRPGGRPDEGGQERLLSQEVARARTSVYTLHIDSSLVDATTADVNRISRTSNDRDRDEDMLGRFLEQFSGSAGGTLLRVLAGSGESSLDRVLRETSAYYLLGVEPAKSDEDGKTRELSVKVNQSGATVRSRSWVTLPKRRT